MFGLKKTIEPVEDAAKPQRIDFRWDDTMHQRAANIWRALGFANDPMNAIPQIAGWLSMYKEWDEVVAKRGDEQKASPAEIPSEK
jgi:hypothetical protein